MQNRPVLIVHGDATARLRLEARLSRRELAEKADLSLQKIRDIENGNGRIVRPLTVRKLALALGCSVEDISSVTEVSA